MIYGIGKDATVSPAHPAYLIIKGDGTLIGSTGCRSLRGKWTERGDEIHFIAFSADGDCPTKLRQQDRHVVNELGDGFRVEINGNRLIVTGRFGGGLAYRTTR